MTHSLLSALSLVCLPTGIGCFGSSWPETRRWKFTTLDSPLETISFGGAKGVVAPPKLAPDVLHQCSRPTLSADGGFWEPSLKDIESLERLIPVYVSTHPPKHAPELFRRLAQYKRQYVGLVQKGNKIIYVNFFLWNDSNGGPYDRRRHAVVICDGGKAFWGIEFDVVSGAFSNLFTNGVA